MVYEIFKSLELTMCFFSMVVHAVGLYILHSLRGSLDINQTQRIFLFNLSLSEFMMMSCEPFKTILEWTNHMVPHHYVAIIQLGGFSLMYYLSMIYLTIDRFFQMYLNITYPLYWSERKTRCLMAAMWVISFVLTVILWVFYQVEKIEYNDILYKYLFPICEGVFLIIAIVTYCYIIHTALRSRQSRKKVNVISHIVPVRSSIPQISQRTTKDVEKHRGRTFFKNSTFYVPTLLIITFIIFMILPDLVYMFSLYGAFSVNRNGKAIIFLTYFFSFTVDAFIYIFLSPAVRRAFMKKFPCKWDVKRLCK